jgi:hypothetical protein
MVPVYDPNVRTRLEIGYLYTAVAAYGIGAGAWIDAEAGQKDAGIALVGPVILGAALPMGVFIVDYLRPMRTGLPSAIASGLVVGAAEGLVVGAFGASAASTTPNGVNSWGLRGLGRSEMIGATVGGLGGTAFGIFVKPTPQRNMFITSGVAWGSVIGYEIGGGAFGGPWADPHGGGGQEATAAGGLIGLNVGLLGVAGASLFWTPSWNQLGWMWGGFAIGETAAVIVYPIYASTHAEARHGLVFQGVAGFIGAIGGAFLGRRDTSATLAREEREQQEWLAHPHFARIRGGSLMPVQGGAGATLTGELW